MFHFEGSDAEQPNPESPEADRKCGLAQNIWVNLGFVLLSQI